MKINAKDKQQKSMMKIFFGWQDREEQHWLEEMAAQGWLLENYTFLRYDFKTIPPADYIYRLDYKTTGDKDMEEYKEIFAQSGWEHVCSYMGWQYLRIPRDQFTVDIYSDKASQMEKTRRMVAAALTFIAPLFIFLIVLDFPGSVETAFERHHLGFLNFIWPIFFILMVTALILHGIWLIKLTQRLKDLENEG